MNCPLCGAELWGFDDAFICSSPECVYQEDEEGNFVTPVRNPGVVANPDYDPDWLAWVRLSPHDDF